MTNNELQESQAWARVLVSKHPPRMLEANAPWHQSVRSAAPPGVFLLRAIYDLEAASLSIERESQYHTLSHIPLCGLQQHLALMLLAFPVADTWQICKHTHLQIHKLLHHYMLVTNMWSG
jgi:hypothetical protein